MQQRQNVAASVCRRVTPPAASPKKDTSFLLLFSKKAELPTL
jgi:hypothetical protein